MKQTVESTEGAADWKRDQRSGIQYPGKGKTDSITSLTKSGVLSIIVSINQPGN